MRGAAAGFKWPAACMRGYTWRLAALQPGAAGLSLALPSRSSLTARYVSGISRHLLHSAHVLPIPCPAVISPCRPGGLLPGCAAACARGARGEPLPSAGHQDRDQDEEGSARNAVARSGGGRRCSHCSRQPRASSASASCGGSSRRGRGGASTGRALASVPVCRVRSRWRLLLLPLVSLPLLQCPGCALAPVPPPTSLAGHCLPVSQPRCADLRPGAAARRSTGTSLRRRSRRRRRRRSWTETRCAVPLCAAPLVAAVACARLELGGLRVLLGSWSRAPGA